MESSVPPPAVTRSVIVVADDLIWVSRLAAAVQRAGATTDSVASESDLDARLGQAHGATVIVDLNGRRYDGVAAVGQAAQAGARVLAVGQHEDQDLRRRALAAGARRVFSYNKLFTDGPAVVRALLDGRL